MNDLNQIARQNAAAIARNAPDLASKGAHVVVEKCGLSVIGCETFTGPGARARALNKITEIEAQGPSYSADHHEPPAEHVGEIRAVDDVSPISLNGGGSSCVSAEPCSTEPAMA
jgi:hypothetical protein